MLTAALHHGTEAGTLCFCLRNLLRKTVLLVEARVNSECLLYCSQAYSLREVVSCRAQGLSVSAFQCWDHRHKGFTTLTFVSLGI